MINFESNIISKYKSNPKILYSYINSQRSCQDCIRSLSNSDGCVTTEVKDIVHLLNKQFCKVFNIQVEEVSNTMKTIKYPCTDAKELFSPILVLKYIRNLNIRKSSGPDGLHPLVIKSYDLVFA